MSVEMKQSVELMKAINKRRLLELVGVSYSTWWRLERAGKAPKRIRLSAGRVGWRLGEVLDYLASRETV
jgi:prophage regulatory protein